MSLTEGIFQRNNDLGAATILDGDNAYNKIYTVVGIDKSTKKPVEAKKITNGLMSALKTADNISAKDNILVSYVFGGTPEQKEFTNVKNTDFLRAYQKGKAVKNADANKIDAKVTTFLSNKSIAKNKGSENIKIETENEKEVTKENPAETNKGIENETNTSTTDTNTNIETTAETSVKGEIKKANNLGAANKAKRVLGTIRKAGIDTELFTKPSKKAGKKILDLDKVKQLSNDLQTALGESLDSDEDIEIDE